MNTKAEQVRGLTAADIAKLVLAVVVLAATIWGYYHYDQVSGSIRAVGVMAGVAIGLVIAAFTGPGRTTIEFLKEAQFELRKVVWPTREETVRTSILVAIVVVIIALLLGGIDLILKWAILDNLLKY